jgi:hypothetical protein
MANDAGRPDLQPLVQAADNASVIRQDEFHLYNAARAAGDLDALTAHYKAFQKAVQIEEKANDLIEKNLLNSPQLLTDLQMLAAANQRLSDAAEAIKADARALNAFTEAANGVLTVLGLIAFL